jgi:hypothetical protein
VGTNEGLVSHMHFKSCFTDLVLEWTCTHVSYIDVGGLQISDQLRDIGDH